MALLMVCAVHIAQALVQALGGWCWALAGLYFSLTVPSSCLPHAATSCPKGSYRRGMAGRDGEPRARRDCCAENLRALVSHTGPHHSGFAVISLS